MGRLLVYYPAFPQALWPTVEDYWNKIAPLAASRHGPAFSVPSPEVSNWFNFLNEFRPYISQRLEKDDWEYLERDYWFAFILTMLHDAKKRMASPNISPGRKVKPECQQHVDTLISSLEKGDVKPVPFPTLVPLSGNEPHSAVRSDITNSPPETPPWIAQLPDGKLRAVVGMAWSEAERAFNNELWLSCCVMCGSVLEGLLGQALSMREREAKAKYKELRKGKEPPENICGWDLSAMIQVARGLELLKSGDSGRIASIINDYRNLVHPGSELHKQFEANEGTAQTSLGQVKVIGNDLLNSAKNPEAGK